MATVQRILVVDNEAGMLEVLEETLRRLGRRVDLELEPSPRRAADRLRNGESFDLLITNLQMPGMSGLQLLRVARDAAPSMRTLVLTGYAAGDTERRCRAAGALGFLAKPFLPEVLLGEVRTLLGEAGSADTTAVGDDQAHADA